VVPVVVHQTQRQVVTEVVVLTVAEEVAVELELLTQVVMVVKVVMD
jgi:hypothetical protein